MYAFLDNRLDNIDIMANRETLKTFLGLTNKELAMLLQVGHSTMGKHGKTNRKLPQDATIVLASMIKYMLSEEAAASQIGMDEQYAKKQKVLERMRFENKYQLETVKRKIINIENRYHYNIKALQLVEFLTQNPDIVQIENLMDVLDLVERRATKSLKKNGLGVLTQLKITYEMLVLEKELLEGGG